MFSNPPPPGSCTTGALCLLHYVISPHWQLNLPWHSCFCTKKVPLHTNRCPTITIWSKFIYTLSNTKLSLWAQSFLRCYSLVITTFFVSQIFKMCFFRCSSSSIVSLISALDLAFGQSVLSVCTLLQEQNCNVQKNTSPRLPRSVAVRWSV